MIDNPKIIGIISLFYPTNVLANIGLVVFLSEDMKEMQ